MVKRGIGIEIAIPRSYDILRKKSEESLLRILKTYPKAMQMYKLLSTSGEINGYWDISNFMVTEKLNFNDHGEVHSKVVASAACKMLAILKEFKIEPDFVSHRGGDWDDAFLIVVTAALLHDIGNMIDRINHNAHGAYLAFSILDKYLKVIYKNRAENIAEIKGFITNAIYTHEGNTVPYTLEGAIIRLADGTDMTKGRGRLAFDLGDAGIHTVSALSIENVKITSGKSKPIRITVEMTNSAGVFQIEQILAKKLKHSPLEPYVEILAITVPERRREDKRIIYEVTVKDGKVTTLDKVDSEDSYKFLPRKFMS